MGGQTSFFSAHIAFPVALPPAEGPLLLRETPGPVSSGLPQPSSTQQGQEATWGERRRNVPGLLRCSRHLNVMRPREAQRDRKAVKLKNAAPALGRWSGCKREFLAHSGGGGGGGLPCPGGSRKRRGCLGLCCAELGGCVPDKKRPRFVDNPSPRCHS